MLGHRQQLLPPSQRRNLRSSPFGHFGGDEMHVARDWPAVIVRSAGTERLEGEIDRRQIDEDTIARNAHRCRVAMIW